MPGAPVPHSEIAAKGHAIAEMLFAIESARALYYRAISEAQVDAPLEAVQRARAAHVTVQRAVVTVTQEAIRVCGGRAFLRRSLLERYARDARAAALMRPWTEEIATQQPGRPRLAWMGSGALPQGRDPTSVGCEKDGAAAAADDRDATRRHLASPQEQQLPRALNRRSIRATPRPLCPRHVGACRFALAPKSDNLWTVVSERCTR